MFPCVPARARACVRVYAPACARACVRASVGGERNVALDV